MIPDRNLYILICRAYKTIHLRKMNIPLRWLDYAFNFYFEFTLISYYPFPGVDIFTTLMSYMR